MSRYHNRETIVFLATILFMMLENEIWRRDPLLRQVGDSWTGRVCPAIRYLEEVLKTAGQFEIFGCVEIGYLKVSVITASLSDVLGYSDVWTLWDCYSGTVKDGL